MAAYLAYRQYPFVSATAGIFAAAEILLYKNISEQSTLSFFKTFNLFSLFDYKITTEYNLISFFGIPIRAELLIWIIVLSVMLLLSAVVVLGAKRNYPMRTPSKLFSFLGQSLKTQHCLFKNSKHSLCRSV